MDPQAFDWYSKLSEVGFPGVLFVILVGSYYDFWLWYKHHKRLTDKHEADYAKLEKEKDRWQTMALGLMEEMAGLVQKVRQG